MVAGDATAIMRAFWSAMTTLRNLLEDVEGADGRIEYLRYLALALVETIQTIDASLGAAEGSVGEGHRLAAALERGAPALGLASEDLRAVMAEADRALDPEELRLYLLRWGDHVLSRFPGAVPNIQGLNGTREVLSTLRRWNRVCEVTGSDFGFMARLLHDL